MQHSGFVTAGMDDPYACLPLRGQHTLAKPRFAPCFPFNCTPEEACVHQCGASLVLALLVVNQQSNIICPAAWPHQAMRCVPYGDAPDVLQVPAAWRESRK